LETLSPGWKCRRISPAGTPGDRTDDPPVKVSGNRLV
jgi:hypothetical protein